MKQSWAFIWLLCLAIAAVNVQAAAVVEDERLDKRAFGTLGSRCRRKHTPKCNKNLICYDGLCYDENARPVKAACSADNQCASGYCARGPGLCRNSRKLGSSCNRNVQCASGLCDSMSAKCVVMTTTPATTSPTGSSTTTTSTTSTTTPTPTAPSSQASAALASATPVSDSAPYNQEGVLQGPGKVSTFGDVQVVDTALGPAVELGASNQNPAVVKQTLDTALARRQTAESKVLSFNYNVVRFVTSDTANGQCNAVPSINGVQLTPPLSIKTGSTSGTAFYNYEGSVSSYAVALVCDAASQARVQFDSVTVKSVDTTSSTTASTTTVSTLSSTTSTTSTTSAATPTATASTCSGLTNCGFESGFSTGYSVSTTGSQCGVVDDPAYVHSGTYGEKCTLADPNSNAFFYINGPRDRNGQAYTVGSDYTLVFWVKFVNGGDASGITCSVYDDTETALYNGVCPITTAAPQNGFYQVAVSFTASSTSIDFYVFSNKVRGIYAFDDFSMLEGNVKFDYTSTTAAPTGTYTTPAAPSGTAQACVGITNCGFETGDTNGYTPISRGSTSCSITSTATNVHSGTYAFGCRISSAESTSTSQGGLYLTVNSDKMVTGTTYDYSFYSKASGDITCEISRSNTYFDGVVPKVGDPDAKGFQQYVARFTVPPTDFRAVGFFDCRFTNPGTYYFDDFALTPVSDSGSTTSSSSSSA